MSILASLTDYYDTLLARGDVPPRGYKESGIGAILKLSDNGEPLELTDWRAQVGNKWRPKREFVPDSGLRTSDIKPFLFWDKTAYTLGVTAIDVEETITPGEADRTADEHASFVALHEEKLSGTTDAGLVALSRFLQCWSWDQYLALEDRGFSLHLLDQNVAFQLDGDKCLLHQRPAARALWEGMQTQDGHKTACLVTGQMRAPARLHPKLKGVEGTQNSGAALVSFNIDAFESYGKSQGNNAPVSEQAAFAYGATLNWLLSRSSGCSIRIGDTTTVFWAEPDGANENAAKAAEAMFAINFSIPQDTDSITQAANVAKLDGIAKGRSLAEIDLRLDPETRMCVLSLSPNNARLAVRLWFVETLGTLVRNFACHYHDLTIEPNPFKLPPRFWLLLLETAAQHKVENIPPRLEGELMRAVLTGSRYPRSLLTIIIQRIRTDKTINAARAALCKAVINRNLRMSVKRDKLANEKEVPVSLDEFNVNTAYLLGRLFSLYEEAETGMAKRNATLRDRYFGMASSMPARIYPVLMRSYHHNVSKLGKGERAGQAVNIEKIVSTVIGNLPDELPRALTLEDQGRFVVGYYHQKRHKRSSNPSKDTSSLESV